MSRRKSVVQFRVSRRRSPRFGAKNEALSHENLESPNFESVSVPRRSPRTKSVEDPKAPNLEYVRNIGAKSSLSPGSCGGIGACEVVVDFRRKEGIGKSCGSELRRSPRFEESCVEQLDGLKLGGSEKKSNTEVRSVKERQNVEQSDGLKWEALKKNSNAKVRNDKECENVGKENVGLRKSSRLSNQKINYKVTDPKLDSALEEIHESGCGSGKQKGKRNGRKSSSLTGSEGELSELSEARLKNSGKEAVRRKRKRKGKEGSGIVRGWTKEQEVALEGAYLAMKPTPRFWKKVSKMVGKSAQECFDRINIDTHTSVSARRKSRIKMKTSPLVSESASKLLRSPKATRKRKTHLGQKKVWELLQKQCNIEKDYDGDLFSVLEVNLNSPLKVFQHTPGGVSTPQAKSHKSRSSSCPGRKKSVSRFSKVSPFIRPSVLKQVKRFTIEKENLALRCNQNPNIIKSAKQSLESEARDVIFQFRQLQAKAMCPSDAEDDMQLSDDVKVRRSSRLSNQKLNYKVTDPKLDSALEEIHESGCGSGKQKGKRNGRKSSSLTGSEEELSKSSEARSKNSGKEAVTWKRTRKGKEGSRVVRGWTKEQEMALERAYLSMKPTPRFWKKVSKMVGKSAQECFDRINIDTHTPVSARRKSRIKMKASPLVSESASKLLRSTKATRKRKTHLGQKKVRELLQKQCNIEKDYEGDLFSVLETNLNSPLKVLQHTPGGVSTPQAKSPKSRSSSYPVRKKSVSRFSNATLLISPPVLKQVKNKALHNKYIDQLHNRDAKRQAELTRAKKLTVEKENLAPRCNQNPNIIKSAKQSLESEARDVIFQFRQLQAKAMNSPSDTEDDMQLSDDENDDDL